MLDIITTTLRHKIWYDLWGARQRTAQAILTIAIGSWVVGTIFGAWSGIRTDTRTNFGPTNPPAIDLRIAPPGDDALLRTLRAEPGLSAVEGVLETRVRWRRTPSAPWQNATLHAREDYADQRLALLRLEGGSWPGGRGFAIERGFPVGLGDSVQLEVADRTSSAHLTGVIYNLSQPSAALGGDPTFYTSRAEFARLTGQDGYGRLLASVPDYTAVRATSAADLLQQRLRDYGFSVQPGSFEGRKVSDPGRAFFQDPVEGVGLILQSIGVIAVLLGLLLVYTTVTAIVAQQTAQIGELKAIGATSRQILWVYYAIVFVYGLVALGVSLPLGILAANALRGALIGMLGLKPASLIVAPGPIVAQVAICIVAPLAVATIPVLRGARVTVREAIGSYGLSGGGGAFEGLIARLSQLPRVVSLALSNALRNTGRVVTTQIALGGAGLTFMAVLSARASVIYTLSGVLLQAYAYPIQINLTTPVSLPRAAQVTQLPGVTGVEGWRLQSASVRPASAAEQTSDPTAQLIGVPVPSASYRPVLLTGRALQPGDTRALLLHERLASDVGAKVGDWLTVSIPDETGARRWVSQQRWQVVGTFVDVTLASTALVPQEALFADLGTRTVNRIQVDGADRGEAATAALATQAQAFYERERIEVQPGKLFTVTQRSAEQLTSLTVVIGLLLLVALIVAGVGAIALSGTLTIGVLERRREIGVLRAIGGTPGFIRTQLVIEGLLLGWLSWVFAVLLSYPVGWLTARLVGASLRISVVYQYAWEGVWIWLVLATVIAIFASLAPARRAIRTSVQESLAYE